MKHCKNVHFMKLAFSQYLSHSSNRVGHHWKRRKKLLNDGQNLSILLLVYIHVKPKFTSSHSPLSSLLRHLRQNHPSFVTENRSSEAITNKLPKLDDYFKPVSTSLPSLPTFWQTSHGGLCGKSCATFRYSWRPHFPMGLRSCLQEQGSIVCTDFWDCCRLASKD